MALQMLLGSFTGLLSLGVIVFTLGMGFFFWRFFQNRIAEEEAGKAR